MAKPHFTEGSSRISSPLWHQGLKWSRGVPSSAILKLNKLLKRSKTSWLKH